jgi:hypothetical protein
MNALTNSTVPGFRRNLADSLAANLPEREANGYLSALYVLRMLALPPAFVRSPEVEAIQDQINLAIARCSEYLASKGVQRHA